MILGIDHVQVACPPGCEERARAFYGELVGLTEIDKPRALAGRGGVWFECGGGHQLHVGVEREFEPALKAHPALRVRPARMHELAERLSGAGVEVSWDDAIPGIRRFYANDPFGNRLEFVAWAE